MTQRLNSKTFVWFLSEDGASLVAQMVKHLPAMRETRVRSLGREDPLEKDMATHSSTLARKIPWTEEAGRLQSMGVAKSRTRLSDFTFLSLLCARHSAKVYTYVWS